MSVETATLRGDGRTNQDQIVVTDRAAAVLDGSTAWLPQQPGRDGGWYARQLAAALTTRLDGPEPLVELLADSIDEVRGRFGLVAGASPESTVTIARWVADSLELLVLGDSPAVAYFAGREQAPTVLLDDRLEPTGAPLRQKYRQHLRDGHGYDDELSALLAELQRAELGQRNRPGGYWSAEADPAAAAHSLTQRFALVDVQAVLLLTDGASAAVDTYGEPATWCEVLRDVQERGRLPSSTVCTSWRTQTPRVDVGHAPRRTMTRRWWSSARRDRKLRGQHSGAHQPLQQTSGHLERGMRVLPRGFRCFGVRAKVASELQRLTDHRVPFLISDSSRVGRLACLLESPCTSVS
jgi:hypothetical protein